MTATPKHSKKPPRSPRLRVRQKRSVTRGLDAEKFIWDGLALVHRDGSDYLNEPSIGGGNPVASNGKVMLNDVLGNTVAVKNDEAYCTTSMTAFGESSDSGAFFTGKPFVGELGYAFLMRSYRPENGKWQTADPMGYPDGWNQLAYCNNHATSSVDLLGCDAIALSDISTDAGIIERVLMVEVLNPGYADYDEAKAWKVMEAMVNCIYNRKNYSNPSMFGIKSKNPTVLDVVTAPGQFAGFSVGADGKLSLSSGLTTLIASILAAANSGAPGIYYRFVEHIKDSAASQAPTPFEKEVYGWRTDGSDDPEGLLVRISNVDGPGKNTLLGQKFYTLE